MRCFAMTASSPIYRRGLCMFPRAQSSCRLIAAADGARHKRPAFRRGAGVRPPDAAAAGRLFVVAGGEPVALEVAAPLLKAMGQRTFVISDRPKSANLVKLSGNFLGASVIEALGEALTLVAKSGIDQRRYLEFLTSTLFDAPIYKTHILEFDLWRGCHASNPCGSAGRGRATKQVELRTSPGGGGDRGPAKQHARVRGSSCRTCWVAAGHAEINAGRNCDRTSNKGRRRHTMEIAWPWAMPIERLAQQIARLRAMRSKAPLTPETALLYDLSRRSWTNLL